MFLARSFSALTIAAAMMVAPDFARAQEAQAPQTATAQENKPTVLRQAGDYSRLNNVVTIAISKGSKDTRVTGEMAGDILVKRLEQAGAKAKYFVAPGGDHTAVVFFLRGLSYGPYGLDKVLDIAPQVAFDYISVKDRPFVVAGLPAAAPSPAPQQ